MRRKTWIAVNKKAVQYNIQKFKALLGGKTKLFAVVKSNAYGHGLMLFSKLADQYKVDGFCVDSIVEGEKLRKEGIKKPILILGPTFKHQLRTAAQKKLTITVSSSDALSELVKSKDKPGFHLKIDTGMHRQGFYLSELPKLVRNLKTNNTGESLTGVYTHFAAAKDVTYPAYTKKQFSIFQKGVRALERVGYKNLIKHTAATGGTLVNPEYHLDAVRVGIGLYGIHPTEELKTQLPKIKLKPALSWHSAISETKKGDSGSYVGYDLTERLTRPTKIAVLPIGYWHGYPRALSGIGKVLIRGKKARVLGRVSMDLIAVDVTGIKCERGDKATLIGAQKGVEISAYDLARELGESYYEIITRVPPVAAVCLIKFL